MKTIPEHKANLNKLGAQHVKLSERASREYLKFAQTLLELHKTNALLLEAQKEFSPAFNALKPNEQRQALEGLSVPYLLPSDFEQLMRTFQEQHHPQVVGERHEKVYGTPQPE